MSILHNINVIVLILGPPNGGSRMWGSAADVAIQMLMLS